MSWRTFRTVLILKPGSNVDPKMVSNWRPIAVLDSSYRLFSKILNTRLLNWISIGDLLSPVQKAVGHSDGCAEHNYLLTALTEKSKRCQTDLHICWLDLADAFGSVPHDVIWLTLDKMGLNPETLAVIQKLYEGSESIYQCQDTFSEPIKILQGVKQDCPLSMTIFCLAIDFLISGSSATQDIPKIQEKPVSILAYADDLVLLANTRAQLQILVNRIVDLASWAHLRFKPAKCGYHSTLNPTTVNSIKIYNTPIAVIDKNHTYKYLGVPHGSPKRHSIKDLMDQALKDFEAVIASKLTMKQKISAYKTFIASRFTYAFRNFDVPLTSLYAKSMTTNGDGNVNSIGYDAMIEKMLKKAFRLPQSTTADYIYTSKDLGGLAIISAYGDNMTQNIVNLFRLFNSPDATLKALIRSELVEVAQSRDNSNVDLVTALDWLAGSEPGIPKSGYQSRSWFSRIRKSFLNAKKYYGIEIRPRLNGTVLELRLKYESQRKTETYNIGAKMTAELCPILHKMLGTAHYDRWCSLVKQGDTVKCRAQSNFSFAVFRNDEVPDSVWQFAVKAHVNGLLLSNSLSRHYAGVVTACRRCRYHMQRNGKPWPESAAHVLQHCHYNEGLIRKRHDSIASMLYEALRDFKLDVTLEEAPIESKTLQRPDIVIRFPNRILLVDVKSPYDIMSNFDTADKENKAKYKNKAIEMETNARKPVIIYTFIVGSLGSWDPRNDSLLTSLGFTDSAIEKLASQMTIKTLRESYYIYEQHRSVATLSPEELESDGPTRIFSRTYVSALRTPDPISEVFPEH